MWYVDQADDRRSIRADLAFLYGPLMRLVRAFDAIFELAVSLGQLLRYLICAERGTAIEGSRLQKYGLSELELVHDPFRSAFRL